MKHTGGLQGKCRLSTVQNKVNLIRSGIIIINYDIPSVSTWPQENLECVAKIFADSWTKFMYAVMSERTGHVHCISCRCMQTGYR